MTRVGSPFSTEECSKQDPCRLQHLVRKGNLFRTVLEKDDENDYVLVRYWNFYTTYIFIIWGIQNRMNSFNSVLEFRSVPLSVLVPHRTLKCFHQSINNLVSTISGFLRHCPSLQLPKLRGLDEGRDERKISSIEGRRSRVKNDL